MGMRRRTAVVGLAAVAMAAGGVWTGPAESAAAAHRFEVSYTSYSECWGAMRHVERAAAATGTPLDIEADCDNTTNDERGLLFWLSGTVG